MRHRDWRQRGADRRVALYGVNLTEASAAVLTYRLFQMAVPTLLGALLFVMLRRKLMHADQPAQVCAPPALDAAKLPVRA